MESIKNKQESLYVPLSLVNFKWLWQK